MTAVAKRNVRDLGPVIDLVRLTNPTRTDLLVELSELHDHVCRGATDCRICQASLPCERLLIKAFVGRWECRA